MKAWEETTIGDLCARVTSGGTPLTSRKEFYENGTIPWLKTTEVHKEVIHNTETYITEEGLKNSSAKLIPANSIVVAMYGDGGTAGKAAITKIPLTTNQACCNLVIDELKADYSFVYYYLKVNYDNIVNLKTGGSQQNLNALTIKKFPIQIPPLPTQHRIASILSAYDDLIEVNNQRIKLLEQTARELYKEWFVRMRFPDYKKTKFKKGIPEGWEVKKLDEVMEFKTGKLNSNAAKEEGKYPFFTCSNTTFKTDTYSFNTEAVLLAGNNAAGIYPLKYFNGKFDAYQRTYIIKPKDDKLSHKYIYHYFLERLEFLQVISIGAATQFLTTQMLKKLLILIPDKIAMDKFSKIADPIFEQLQILQQQNTQLRQIRDRLLPRLVSGKLQVKGV